MKTLNVWTVTFVVAFFFTGVFAAAPVVSNVRVAQRPGTGILDITYDLADPDSDILSVAVNVSTDDGVSWFSPAASNLTGAVGSTTPVAPGVDRSIVWRGEGELRGARYSQFKVKVLASQGGEVAWYRMDDNTTSRVVVDSSPSAVCASNIAQNTSARTVSGVVGSGLSFLNDEAAVSTNAAALSVFNGTSWTVAFWGKRANTYYHTEWFWVYDSVNSGMGWYYSRDLNAMSWLWYYGTTSGTNMACAFPAGTWRHFVFTRSGSSLRFYVDGVLSGTAAPMGAPAISTSIYFGGDATSPSYTNTRYLDDLRIYGGALTDEEVAVLYNKGSGLKPPLFGGEISSDVSSSMVYDLAQPYMAVGYPVTPIGDTNFVQEVGDHYSAGDLSIQLGGVGLPDGGMAGIEWNVTGPGVMAFDWMVSSEEGKDGLRFYEIGGTETNFMSGTGAGWTRIFATVSGATNVAHTLRWEYVKDPSGGSDGMDCGWVDALCWAPTHTLTVSKGSGSGAYTNGAVAGVTADVPPAGTRFNVWTGDTACVSSVTSSSTFVTMPTSNVSIVATYISVYALTVNSGGGGGLYTNGQWVAVTADAPPTGKLFSRWTGETQVLSNALLSSTFVRMPSRAVGITASYVDAFALTVNSGSGDGLYPAGQRVTITADAPPFGMGFDRWTGDIAAVSNVTSSSTTVVMPASAVTVTASYFSYNSLLPESRVLDFNDYLLTNNTPQTWVHQGSPPAGATPNRALLAGTNHFHRTGWRFNSCRTGCSGYLTSALCVPPLLPATTPVYPKVATNLAANLRNDLGAFIESPVFTNGVGTVYFEAINELAACPTQITVELATNMVSSESGAFVGTVAPPSTNGLEYVWQTLDVLDLNAATTNDFVRYRKGLNARLPAKLRIRRSGTKYDSYNIDSAFSVVDNIRVSPPPCDVVIERPSCVSSPGYPSARAPLTLRCVVSNDDTNAPTVSRTVSVCTRWRYRDQTYGPWTTNAMARVDGTGDGQGNGEWYEGSVPTPGETGDIDYYFICAFGGPFYTSPDYTLTGLNGYPYPTESLSPRVYRGTGAEFSVRVRPYASEYGGVAIESEQLAAPLPMTLVGDGVWRGLVPVGGGGLTNFTWRFKAADAYEDQTQTYSADVVYWAGSGEKAWAPFEGACAEDDGSGRLCLSCRACGYAMVTLDTRTLRYRVQCAEAQDFNVWPAPPDVYSEGCSQVATRSFAWGNEAWPTNAETTFVEPFSSLTVSTNVFSREPFPTPADWVGGSSAYVSERTFDESYAPGGVTSFLNLALRLKNGDGALRLGYVRNSEATLTDGIKSVAFKSRLEQSFDNYDIAYWRWGFTNYNYLVRATARARDAGGLSPESPSLSLIAYYSDPGDFYEFRVTAIADPSSTPGAPRDKRVMCELYKWMSGVPALLTQSSLSAAVADTALTSVSDGAPMEMRLYNASAAATQIRCKFLIYDDVLVYADGVQPLQCGTFGFVSGNCLASLSSVLTYPTASGAYQTGTASYVLRSDLNFSPDVSQWYFPTNRYVALSNFSPKGIYSVIPKRLIGVYVRDADGDANLDNNSSDWKLAGTVTVTNFTYQTNTVFLNTWKRQYVKLQAMGDDDDVAVDEVSVTSWHGGQAGAGDADSWLATEAWVVSNSASRAHVVRLDHSKGNPELAQGVRSLLLTNGLGALEFSYRVVRPPARLTVQYALAAQSNEWFELKSFLVTNTTDWLYASAYLGQAGAGYFRVVNARPGDSTNACVEIDNARVWEAPQDGGASWRAYNARITASDASRVALDGTKACFLNNSQTAEALPIQDQHEPSIQSPALANGLGYLSFAARAFNAGESATVRILVATNGWSAADAQWFEIKRFENITNTLYQTFVYDVPSGFDCDAVRLVTRAAGGEVRACLDDVVVAEPLVAFADLVGVSSSVPRQTILKSGETVDISLRLAGRFGLRKGASDATTANGPLLGVVVNGEMAWAPLQALTETQTEEGWRTDAIFRYTVRPGDLAAPLRLTGAATQRHPYVFQWNGWEIYNQNTSSNAVWRFASRGVSPDALADPDLSRDGPVLKTLSFDAQTENWVAASRMLTWRVLTDTNAYVAPVQVWIWTPQTNILQVGTTPGQSAVLADVSAIAGTGVAGASFTVVGIAQGTADVYVQRVSDFANNAANGVTNYIKRTIAVTPAPVKQWGALAGVLTGGGVYRVDTCETDAGGASVVCDGGDGAWVYRFVGDHAVAFTNLTLSVSNGATVVIEDLNIDNRSVDGRTAVNAADGHPGNTLALIGENAVWGGRLAAGVCVQADGGSTNALSIVSGGGTNGALTSQGGVLSAGIGGAVFESGGALSIRGHAVVTAVGGDFGAGVGGGIEAAGGSVDVAEQAVLMVTGGRDTACDIGPGTYCSDPASLRFSGGLILTGTGVSRVSDFAAGCRDSRAVGVFDSVGWYALSRNGEPAMGRMYVAAPSIGVHAVSNVTQAGVYALTSAIGGAAVTFKVAWASPAVPVGSHGNAAFYASWLDRHGVGALDFSAVAPGVFDAAWLLDQNPRTFVSGEVVITEFHLEAGVVRGSYTVRAKGTEGSQTVTHLNGRLVVMGANALTDAFVEVAEITATLDAGTYAFEIPCVATTRFIKIAVVFPE